VDPKDAPTGRLETRKNIVHEHITLIMNSLNIDKFIKYKIVQFNMFARLDLAEQTPGHFLVPAWNVKLDLLVGSCRRQPILAPTLKSWLPPLNVLTKCGDTRPPVRLHAAMLSAYPPQPLAVGWHRPSLPKGEPPEKTRLLKINSPSSPTENDVSISSTSKRSYNKEVLVGSEPPMK
jgi:hypothetical protein